MMADKIIPGTKEFYRHLIEEMGRNIEFCKGELAKLEAKEFETLGQDLVEAWERRLQKDSDNDI